MFRLLYADNHQSAYNSIFAFSGHQQPTAAYIHQKSKSDSELLLFTQSSPPPKVVPKPREMWLKMPSSWWHSAKDDMPVVFWLVNAHCKHKTPSICRWLQLASSIIIHFHAWCDALSRKVKWSVLLCLLGVWYTSTSLAPCSLTGYLLSSIVTHLYLSFASWLFLFNGVIRTMANHAATMQLPSMVRSPKMVWPGLDKEGLHLKSIAGDGEFYHVIVSIHI